MTHWIFGSAYLLPSNKFGLNEYKSFYRYMWNAGKHSKLSGCLLVSISVSKISLDIKQHQKQLLKKGSCARAPSENCPRLYLHCDSQGVSLPKGWPQVIQTPRCGPVMHEPHDSLHWWSNLSLPHSQMSVHLWLYGVYLSMHLWLEVGLLSLCERTCAWPVAGVPSILSVTALSLMCAPPNTEMTLRFTCCRCTS